MCPFFTEKRIKKKLWDKHQISPHVMTCGVSMQRLNYKARGTYERKHFTDGQQMRIHRQRRKTIKGRWPETSRRAISSFYMQSVRYGFERERKKKNSFCSAYKKKKKKKRKKPSPRMPHGDQLLLVGLWFFFFCFFVFYCSKKVFPLSGCCCCVSHLAQQNSHWFMVWVVYRNKRRTPPPLGYVNERHGS